jgi:signal transduction histidine kinase
VSVPATAEVPPPSWPPRRKRDPAADRHSSLRRWLLVTGGIAMAFAILAVGLGAFAMNRLDERSSVVLDRVNPALQAAKDLTNAVTSQESAVRGYTQSARVELLEPYLTGQDAERDAAVRLNRLAATGQLGTTDADVAAVRQHMEAWRRDYAEPTIAAVRAGELDRAVDPEVGNVRSDAARAAAADLTAHLNEQSATATESLQQAAGFLRVVLAGIGIGLLALIVAVGVWAQRAVTLPLSRLAREVRLVVAGDAHREVRVSGPSEIVGLSADIDSMRRHILAELDALEAAHQRLDEQARDLERSNRDLEQFAYVASHDLQEPLRKVSSFCQLLQRRYGGQLDERGESYIEFAVDGARRMQQLINDLLAFSRVGRMSAGLGKVDLNEVADAAVAQLSTMSEELDARINVEPLPTVRGEAGLLTQLLANLVGNALKFRRPGIPPAVNITARWREEGWEVAVADNGIGVEQEYADKVFVIFQRLHSREEYPGTGIGLAMAKKIVEYHGGRIWIDADREDGTTVRFTLPVYLADEAASEDAPVGDVPAAGSSTGQAIETEEATP